MSDNLDSAAIETIVRNIVSSVLAGQNPTPADTIRTGTSAMRAELDAEMLQAGGSGKGEDFFGFSSAESDSESIPPGLAAYKIYWDDSAKDYKMFQPVVALPNGTRFDVKPPAIKPGESYYLHVYHFESEDDENKAYKAEITDTGEAGVMGKDSDSHWCVLIADIASQEGIGMVTQHHLGVVAVSAKGKGGHTGPFEPVFDGAGKLSSYANGLYPYGRRFFRTSELDDSARVATGFIGLEITHSTYDKGIPSAKVVGGDTASVLDANYTSTEKTVLPLYELVDGEIAVDYRCLMALAVRE